MLSRWVVVLYSGLATLCLAACSSPPLPVALEVARQAEEHKDFYFFRAENNRNGRCYLFYPGGRVMPEAYSPYLRAVADSGIHAFLLRPRLQMALFDVGIADRARLSDRASELCSTYYVGGHSIGGVATATYGRENPHYPLLLIGSYVHAEGLEHYPKTLYLVYGSNDLLVTDHIEENRDKLPPQAVYRTIEGGNHAQMGYYGEQRGDGVATISREAQQRQLVAFTLEFFALAEAPGGSL